VPLAALIIENKVQSPDQESQTVGDYHPPGLRHPLFNWGGSQAFFFSPAIWCNCGKGRRALVKREWGDRTGCIGVRYIWALNF